MYYIETIVIGLVVAFLFFKKTKDVPLSTEHRSVKNRPHKSKS